MAEVRLTSGVPETVLDEEPSALTDALESAGSDRSQVAAVVADWPRSSLAWAVLGDLGRDTIERYAAYRVGYHRGLDRLRQSGWRGSGYVRWSASGNRGFLRCLAGLAAAANEIGEADEHERCLLFLKQLDPQWPPTE